MNLHEYQGKSILSKHGVKIQRGVVIEKASEAIEKAKQLSEETGTKWYVVKAQIHAGGRGKAGGVKVAKGIEQLQEKVDAILGATLHTPQTPPEGKKVNKVLITEDVYYEGESEPQEFYISILLDRATSKNVIVYSPEGGMDIEEVAEKTPDKIFKEFIEPGIGLQPFQANKVAYNLGLSGQALKEMRKFITQLYNCYLAEDASMIEINPAFKTADNQVMAVDCKFTVTEEDPTEVEAGKNHLNFIKLDGNVGCMVNGAGLAMATMDIIKLSGGSPANFLDVGGTANAERVEKAFRIILQDEHVKAILVNIFGGIVRCDRVAQGIVDAYQSIGEIKVPIIVRLQGTNAEEAKKIIDDSGLKVHSAILLSEAAAKVQEVLA